MGKILNLYLDDSGTRHPDRKIGRAAAHGYDWFALGGFLITDEDELIYRDSYKAFCEKWSLTYPLRSANIRSQSENFRWLADLSNAERTKFYEALYVMMREAPVIGIGCTIDRPGYNARYREKYGRNRWQLCKTAFSIVVERSAKYARKNDHKLRVYVERGDKKTDRQVKGYYDDMRQTGMPFSGGGLEKYAPLNATELEETLYDFKTKQKTSPMSQLADLYLWPIAIGGYDKGNRTYSRLLNDRKILDCHLEVEEVEHLGCKYSCFELATKVP